MIKVEVTKNTIIFLGHANYDEYGKDIVCASASTIAMTSIEAIARFDKDAVDVKEENNKLTINIHKHNNITDTLISNMLSCLQELEKKYSKNIKIINREE